MRIKDEIVCFAQLRWCHNGWASNILIVVDTGYAGIHHSKYWMPIHYDTIEDGQNKQSHLLFFNWEDIDELLVSYKFHGSDMWRIYLFSFGSCEPLTGITCPRYGTQLKSIVPSSDQYTELGHACTKVVYLFSSKNSFNIIILAKHLGNVILFPSL